MDTLFFIFVGLCVGDTSGGSVLPAQQATVSCEAQVSARGGRDGSSAKIEHGQGGGVTEGHMEPQRRGANISRMPGDACY